ncbi:MAG: hypothetical protein IPM97_01305 [Bdellovibrionaceae bacterium]|nr:hypothetical protein [Pseudobdellovibrionaceae bacterium]
MKKLAALTGDTKIKAYYLSRDPVAQKFQNVQCLLWSEGIEDIFEIEQGQS